MEHVQVDVKSSDALLELLRNEAIQSSNSLKLATQVHLFSRYHDFFVVWMWASHFAFLKYLFSMILQAMVAARKKIDSLQKRLDMTGTSSQQEQEVIRNRDALSLGESLVWPKSILFLLGPVPSVFNVWGYVPKCQKRVAIENSWCTCCQPCSPTCFICKSASAIRAVGLLPPMLHTTWMDKVRRVLSWNWLGEYYQHSSILSLFLCMA